MELSRRLQGRLHDVNMNLASHAARTIPDNTERSTYTAPARQILELMSRYTRLFNLFTYASFTRSHRPILTPRGLRRLVERGLMTATEREVLVDAVIPATQRHSVVLLWMIRLFVDGRNSGHIQGGHGFEAETMHKFHIIRSQYGAIGDELQGRMPLAYAHIVQILVDLILWMFPIMAFSMDMAAPLVVVGTGLLTISYQGLFDLAKQFLDPYDNESYGRGEDPLCVDTLIAETNAGSIRWLYGLNELPYNSQKLSEGEIYEYLLPVRGYSVEEVESMEEERIKRERQLESLRRLEEEEKMLQDFVQEVTLSEEKVGIDEANDQFVKSNVTEFNTSSETNSNLELESVSFNLTTEDQAIFIDETNAKISIGETQEKINSSSGSDIDKETKPVHTVTTLATGTIVSSFKPLENIETVVEEPVPTGMQTSNYLATLKKEKRMMDTNVSTLNKNLLDFDDDHNRDSRDILDGVNGDEKQIEIETTNREQNQGEDNEVYGSYNEPNHRRNHCLNSSAMYETIEQDNDIDSSFVRKLMLDADTSAPFETPITTGIMKKGGNDYQVAVVESSDLFQNENDLRLSEMLANEEWGKESNNIEISSMSPEEYDKQIEEVTTTAEEEARETEAILLSKPGTDPIGWDYDDEQLTPMSNTSNAERDGNSNGSEIEYEDDETDVDLAILEMDVNDDTSIGDDNQTLSEPVYGDIDSNPEPESTNSIDKDSEVIEAYLNDVVEEISSKAKNEVDSGEHNDAVDSKIDMIQPMFIDENFDSDEGENESDVNNESLPDENKHG